MGSDTLYRAQPLNREELRKSRKEQAGRTAEPVPAPQTAASSTTLAQDAGLPGTGLPQVPEIPQNAAVPDTHGVA
jgi:hypothetical protein